MFEKSSSPEAEVSTYSTEFDGRGLFKHPMIPGGSARGALGGNVEPFVSRSFEGAIIEVETVDVYDRSGHGPDSEKAKGRPDFRPARPLGPRQAVGEL